MKFYVRDNEVEVVLSRRNLLAGLHKLDMPGSARELQKPSDDGDNGYLLRLRFEDDAEHYGSRGYPAGPMHPATEAFIEEDEGPCS